MDGMKFHLYLVWYGDYSSCSYVVLLSVARNRTQTMINDLLCNNTVCIDVEQVGIDVVDHARSINTVHPGRIHFH